MPVKATSWSKTNELTAFVDSYAPVSFNGELYLQTIRAATCELLVHGGKCKSCKEYRGPLRAMHSRWTAHKGKRASKYTNDQHLNTPQKKQKLDGLKARAQEAEREVKRLQAIIEKFTEESGVSVDPSLGQDLITIMCENSDKIAQVYHPGSFRSLFWEQQLKAAKAKGASGMRWHPMMIRWALNLKMISSAGYHAMKTAGFIQLPSERTLRDYTHFFQTKPGFQREVNQELMKEAKISELDEIQKHVAVVFDEMRIKEDLVYNKHTGEVIGFVNLGDINNQLSSFEKACTSDTPQHPEVATHMLVLMVRGLVTGVRFPYAHFFTAGVTADFLFPIVWKAIQQLEMCGFKVFGVTSDGASPNRKFYRMHGSAEKGPHHLPLHKVRNPYSQEERYIYFFSDVPHLLKTTRNCWSHPFSNGCTRELWVSI